MTASYIFAGAGTWRGGSVAGVFRHPAGDGEWEQLKNGLPQPASVHAIVVHPQNPDLIYAGTQDGPYYSTDRGTHWHRPDFPDSGTQIWSILVDPSDPHRVFAGAAPVAIYRSEDSGEHWRLLSRPTHPERAKMSFACRVMRIALDPNRPRELFATIEVNGVMRSRDGGENWSDCSAGLLELAKEPRFKSKIGSDTEAEGMLDGHALCVSTADPGAVFLACRMGLFRSGDGGDTWQDMAVGRFSPLTYARDIRPAPHDPRTLYACLSVHATGDTGSLAKSSDLGQSWQRFDHGITLRATMMNLALHQRDPLQVYGVARNGQVIGTQDGGAIWSEYPLPPGCQDVYAIACG